MRVLNREVATRQRITQNASPLFPKRKPLPKNHSTKSMPSGSKTAKLVGEIREIRGPNWRTPKSRQGRRPGTPHQTYRPQPSVRCLTRRIPAPPGLRRCRHRRPSDLRLDRHPLSAKWSETKSAPSSNSTSISPNASSVKTTRSSSSANASRPAAPASTIPASPSASSCSSVPSGVGKTETALALSDLLYGGEHNLISINMSEFQEPHTVSTLKGSPPATSVTAKAASSPKPSAAVLILLSS